MTQNPAIGTVEEALQWLERHRDQAVDRVFKEAMAARCKALRALQRRDLINGEDGYEDAALTAALAGGKGVSFIEAAATAERDGPRPFVPPTEVDPADTSFLRNRRVAAQPVEFLKGKLRLTWIVSDRYDYGGQPFSYATRTLPFQITQAEGGWVVVNDRGQYLRTGDRWDGDRRRIRRFKTPAAAAVFAESRAEALLEQRR